MGLPERNISDIRAQIQQQGITIRKNTSADVGTRPRLNFIEGTGIILTVADDSSSNEVDITIDASGAVGILSLNGLTASAQTFAKVDDTNVTLAISSISPVHTFTMGWTGTLADGRIASAANWNSKQAGHANLTSLSSLVFVSASFVKMTGANTFSLDTNTYLTANQTITLSGDVSGSGTTAITTILATVNANTGTWGSATQVGQFTVNGKGLITAASNVTVTPAASSITGGANLTVGTSLSITSGTGTAATLVALGINTIQGIRTADSPQFAGLTISTGNILITGAATGVQKITFEQPDGAIYLKAPASITTSNTITFPEATGTVAVSASGNMALSSTTGNITISASPTFATSVTSPIIIGGTATTSTLTLKTTTGVGTTNADMIFQVGNNGATEAMRILNSGLVGIGTTAPLGRLHIANQSGEDINYLDRYGNASGFAYRRANGTAGSPTACVADDIIAFMGARGYGATGFAAGSKGFMSIKAAENWSDANQGTYFAFHTTPKLSTTAAERMRIDDAGNVGIGATSPLNILHIGGFGSLGAVNTGNQIIMTYDAAGNYRNSIYNNYDGAVAANNYMRFQICDKTTTGQTQVMTLQGDGNVGIGVSPAVRLDVLSANNQFRMSTGAANSYYGFNCAAGSCTLQDFTDGSESIQLSNGGFIYFGVGSATRMTIDSAGLTTHTTNSNSMIEAVRLENAGTVSATSGVFMNFTFGGTSVCRIAAINASTTAMVFSVDSSGTERMRLNVVGNLKLAGTAVRGTTEGTNHLDIFNGTAPVGTLTNGISLYSTSGELRVMDSAGNATLLSPHDKEGNWIYDSVDSVTGKRLKIDMEKFMRFLNKKFGTDFVHEYIEAV